MPSHPSQIICENKNKQKLTYYHDIYFCQKNVIWRLLFCHFPEWVNYNRRWKMEKNKKIRELLDIISTGTSGGILSHGNPLCQREPPFIPQAYNVIQTPICSSRMLKVLSRHIVRYLWESFLWNFLVLRNENAYHYGFFCYCILR